MSVLPYSRFQLSIRLALIVFLMTSCGDHSPSNLDTELNSEAKTKEMRSRQLQSVEAANEWITETWVDEFDDQPRMTASATYPEAQLMYYCDPKKYFRLIIALHDIRIYSRSTDFYFRLNEESAQESVAGQLGDSGDMFVLASNFYSTEHDQWLNTGSRVLFTELTNNERLRIKLEEGSILDLDIHPSINSAFRKIEEMCVLAPWANAE